MHAACLELLQEQMHEGARALDVGSGSGYLTACMALMVGPSGYVLGIEKVRSFVVWQAWQCGLAGLGRGGGGLGWPPWCCSAAGTCHQPGAI